MSGETLRVELRCRNNVLWHRIFDVFPSVAAFCRAAGLLNAETIVGGLLNLKFKPYNSKYRPGNDGSIPLTKTAEAICTYFNDTPFVLFPPDLYEVDFMKSAVAEIDHRRFLPLVAARRLALPPSAEDGVIHSELKDTLDAVLDTLTPREAKIMRARFGLDDGNEKTTQEVALEQGVSRERIRQIEAKAMLKLRHPKRSKQLRPFIDVA
jgi:RNA polymerase sigma factor, sigma-70 family